MSWDNTPPSALPGVATQSNTAPTSLSGLTQTGDASVAAVAPAVQSGEAPSGFAPVAQGNTAPTALPSTINTDLAPAPIPGAVPDSLPNMPSAFTPAFIELTGAGPSLVTLTANSADIGKIVQGTVDGELRSYQVRAGSDAQALPGIVRPSNFDADTNAVVFVSL